MKCITIGPASKHKPVTKQMLDNAHKQMSQPSNDRTQICNVLRLAKGSYSHRRSKTHKAGSS